MSAPPVSGPPVSSGLDRAVGRLLSWGTVLASLLIALGLVLAPLGGGVSVPPGRLVGAGIAVIVVLPVLRVILMGLSFLRTGDRDLAGIALLVLAIIAVASIIGAAGV